VVGVVQKVLVKTNDKVFAGEPLIQLADDELRARLAAAETQVGLARARPGREVGDRQCEGRGARRWMPWPMPNGRCMTRDRPLTGLPRGDGPAADRRPT
jgi:hypothetical protein